MADDHNCKCLGQLRCDLVPIGSQIFLALLGQLGAVKREQRSGRDDECYIAAGRSALSFLNRGVQNYAITSHNNSFLRCPGAGAQAFAPDTAYDVASGIRNIAGRSVALGLGDACHEQSGPGKSAQ